MSLCYVLSEVSQIEKNKYYIFTYVKSKTKPTNTANRSKPTDTENKLVISRNEGVKKKQNRCRRLKATNKIIINNS